MRQPTAQTPECGWALIDGKYEYYSFDGSESQFPEISLETIGFPLKFYITVKYPVLYIFQLYC